MPTLKTLLVYGTRPEAIKMAPVYLALRDSGLQVELCITAQHRQMLDSVMEFFGVQADYDLNLMQPNQSLNQLTSRIFMQIDEVLTQSKPDWVLVHGDTTTSSASAWAAFHRGIKVAHVEAGLRTYNKHAPFPEEINRQVTSRIADLHFAPTLSAQKHLKTEGVSPEHILVTGNTVIDALHIGLNKIEAGYTTADVKLARNVVDKSKRIILVTGHRRENFGQGFENLCKAIRHIADVFTDVQIVYPVHLNPNVQEPVMRILGKHPHIQLIEPVDYPSFLYLMKYSYFILTDSGGVQEEAPSLGKPVLVMREVTERPEAVEAGTVKLTGPHFENIVSACTQLLTDTITYSQMSQANNPYGDGRAAQRIADYFVSLNQLIQS